MSKLSIFEHSVVQGEFYWSWTVDGVLGTVFQTQETVELVEKCTYQFNTSDTLSSIKISPGQGAMDIRCPTIGGRPLYFYTDNLGQFFCSTHINMLRQAGVPIAENSSVLGEYLMYRCVMPPRTMYKDISQVMLGGNLNVHVFDTKTVLTHNYFQISGPQKNETFGDATEKIKLKIGDCLVRNTTSNGKFLLSGGVDSSIVFRLSQERLGAKETWSSGYPFEEPNLDMEQKYATSAADSFGSTHRHFLPTTERYQEAIIYCIAAAELPLHHLQSPLMYLMSKDGFEASSKDAVVNSVGAGGLFGNFRNFLFYQRHRRFRLLNNSLGKFLLKQIQRTAGHGEYQLQVLKDANQSSLEINADDSIWQWHAYGSWEWVKEYANQSWDNVIKGPKKTLNEHHVDSIEDLWALYSFVGDETTTVNIWSKLSEAADRPTLFPFYDDHVVDIVKRISWTEKLAHPQNRLRKSLARSCNISPEVINRKKSGFGIRRLDWARLDGPFQPLVSIAAKELNKNDLERLQSDENMAMSFWILLNYGLWKRLCINGESREELIGELQERRK